MRCLFAASMLLLLVAPLSADDRLDVHVLYCGDPGSAREADFRSFLEQQFTKVTVSDLSKFKEEQARDSDVVVVDWSYVRDEDDRLTEARERRLFNATPKLGKEYTRPTVLVGEAGGSVAQNLHLKTDWLCLCLSNQAHKLALDHPVFHTPLKVDPRLVEIATPARYRYQTIGGSLGPTIKVWRIQTKDYREIPVDPGLVSTLYGFTDSPDAELIGQGIAMTGPDAVALGRQANFFLWGFSSSPSGMTPAGQRLFVNVVSYMRQFAGQAPLVQSKCQSREWALRYAAIPRELSDDGYWRKEEEEMEKLLAKHPDRIPAEFKGDSKPFVMSSVENLRKTKNSSMEYLLPEPLRKEFGNNPDKYIAY